MRRIAHFGRSEVTVWEERLGQRPIVAPEEHILRQGLDVYAQENIARERAIEHVWLAKWATVRARAAPIIAGLIPDDSISEEDEGSSEIIEIDLEDDEDMYGSDDDLE